jgi:hypothetical protein
LAEPATRRTYDAQYAFIKLAGTKNETTKGSGIEKNQRATEREKKLQELNAKRCRQDRDVLERRRKLNKLQAEVAKLQEEIDKAVREQAAKTSWWGYLSSILPGQVSETEEQREQRDRDRYNKKAVWAIKEAMMERQMAEVRNYEAALESTKYEIILLEAEIRREKDEEGVKMMMEQERLRRERINRMAEEMAEEIKKRAEKWRAQQAWSEETRKKEEAKERQRMKVEREERKKKHEADERREWAQTARSRTTYTKETCHHRGWWVKVEHPTLCSRCMTLTRRFALKCPGCGTMACASCCRHLKGTQSYAHNSNTFTGRKDFHSSTYAGYAGDDFSSYWD